MNNPGGSGPDSITGVVLAGGAAERMGGGDKGLLPLAGKPLIEHVLDVLKPQVACMLISANRNPAQYERYGLPVIADERIGFQGPLAGIAAAMRAARTPLLLAVPCDSPFLPGDLARRLGAALDTGSADISVASVSGRLQPVFALLRTRLLDSLLEYLERGERKVERWFSEQQAATADFSDVPDAFLNINTPEDLREMETRMRQPARATR